MRIWFSRYELKPKASLGAHAVLRSREGSLLKIEFADGSVGFSDLHPWTELGDEPLADQLKSLATQTPSKLASRSIELASLDAAARSKEQSAFQDLEVPDSHFLFTDANEVSREAFGELKALGFAAAKIKIGKDLELERKILETVYSDTDEFSEIRLRLDFNSSLNKSSARSWLLGLSEGVNDAIEFVEDPCVWNAGDWRRLHAETGVDFFKDRGSLFDESVAAESFQGLVLKPACQDLSVFQKSELKLVVTSYLDHPVGQMSAALEAARLNARVPLALCGLLSQRAYEPSVYSEQIPSEGPALKPSSREIGIGFTELLGKENWKLV